MACLVTVTLVSGTFRVSLAERVRQFGLLSSAGASCRQLVRAVLVEAALLCAVGIPAGLALGVALDAVALTLVADGTAWVTGGVPVALDVHPEALLGAAAVSAATVLLSALAPALRASRLPAVEAMRGDGSTGARGGRPGTGAPLPRRTAGGRDVTALLASRFHRAGRGRDRATVAALAVSVALLVGGGVLGAYFGRVSVLEGTPADVSAGVSAEGTANVPGAEGELPHLPALLERLRALPGIRSAGFVSKTQTLLDLDDSSVATWAKESLWRPEGNLPDAAGDDVFGTVYYVDDVTWELLLGEAGAEKDAQGCVVVNEVLDSGHEGQQPFGDALLGTRLSLSGTEVSWEVVGLLDEVPGWFWLSRGELESVLPTVLAPASSVAGADREDIGYGMTTLYATANDSSAAAADVDRLLEENPALATWDGVVDERAEAHRSEALYGAIRALLSTFGVAAAAVGVASAFNSSAASVLLRAHGSMGPRAGTRRRARARRLDRHAGRPHHAEPGARGAVGARRRRRGTGGARPSRQLRPRAAPPAGRTAHRRPPHGVAPRAGASARPCSDLGSLQGPQESPQQSTFSVSAGSTRAGSYRSLLEDLTTNPNPLGACRLNVGSSGRQVSARR